MDTILRLLAENPESLGEVVKTYITKYKEPVYDVLKELMIIAKDYSENTEYPAIQARTKKNMFDAYSLLQRDVYELMFRKGWYSLEEADSNKVSSKYQMLSQEFTELNG